MSAVELTGISKSFGAVKALEDVFLQVETGTLHAVVGENGAGKTTLMYVLYGAIQPDAGTIEVDGTVRSFRNSAESAAAGIGMMSQHYSVIPALTCLQNLVLGAEGGLVLNPKGERERAESLAQRMGFSFDWKAEASTLSPAATQKLEILKLLWRNANVMILDEPTAMLGPADAEALFASMRSLVDKGASVILVTHRLPEVMTYCSHVTVMRAGRRVADMPVNRTDPAELVRLIIGSDRLDHKAPVGGTAGAEVDRSKPPLFEAKALTVKDDRGHQALKAVDLQIRPREVVGVAGVDGNGQRELVQAILGLLPAFEGTVVLDGTDQSNVSTSRRLEDGLRVIPEERQSEAVVEAWPLVENAALGLQRSPTLGHRGIVNLRARSDFAARVAERFTTRHGGLSLPFASLSGGNQQRFVAARALELGPKLLVAFQPARGLDLGGTADVYAAIRDECAKGMGALIISFDIDELLLHCDRIVVLNGGQLTEAPLKDRNLIGQLMVGAA